MIWDILIASTWRRTESLGKLLDALGPQMVPGVGVVIARDNIEVPIGPKRQRLVESSRADYICFVDDDDMVSEKYVGCVLDAMSEGPGVIGFRARYFTDGVPHPQDYLHTTIDPNGVATPPFVVYGLSHLNPIRRDIALTSVFEGGGNEDSRWVAGIQPTVERGFRG